MLDLIVSRVNVSPCIPDARWDEAPWDDGEEDDDPEDEGYLLRRPLWSPE